MTVDDPNFSNAGSPSALPARPMTLKGNLAGITPAIFLSRFTGPRPEESKAVSALRFATAVHGEGETLAQGALSMSSEKYLGDCLVCLISASMSWIAPMSLSALRRSICFSRPVM